MNKLNIVYIHAHDLGRFCEPFGYAIPAPNMMKLAREGVLFRQCHASAPSCAPSRAALVTGQYPHSCGMFGLPAPHLKYRLNDYSKHIAGYLRDNGYTTALSGVQHVAHGDWAPMKEVLPYDRFLNHTPTEQQIFDPAITASAAVEFLSQKHDKPFFLSVGFLDPHRDNKDDPRIFIESQPAHEPADIDDRARYCQPWPHMPDNAITRRDMANFKMGVEMLDNDIGRVMNALNSAELRDNTLVICTTDHGPGICEAKCTLTDHGTGVLMIIRGPRNPEFGEATLFNGGRVVDAMTQQIDLYPTLCELIGIEPPDWLQGQSMLPLVRGEKEEIHEALFTEQTHHFEAAERPFRAVRTKRYKYIRSYLADQLRGVDPGPPQRFWEEHGYAELPFPDEMLFDLLFDPNEANNLAGNTDYADVLEALRTQLQEHMQSTGDPLVDGVVPPPPAIAG